MRMSFAIASPSLRTASAWFSSISLAAPEVLSAASSKLSATASAFASMLSAACSRGLLLHPASMVSEAAAGDDRKFLHNEPHLLQVWNVQKDKVDQLRLFPIWNDCRSPTRHCSGHHAIWLSEAAADSPVFETADMMLAPA